MGQLDRFASGVTPITPTEVGGCEGCGEVVYIYELTNCPACGARVHQGCVKECEVCGAQGCRSCMVKNDETLGWECKEDCS